MLFQKCIFAAQVDGSSLRNDQAEDFICPEYFKSILELVKCSNISKLISLNFIVIIIIVSLLSTSLSLLSSVSSPVHFRAAVWFRQDLFKV